MKKYEMKITPHTDASGQSYWVVNFPAIDACSGGGYTVEDAIKEAEENLNFYLEYLENEKIRLPEEYKENMECFPAESSIKIMNGIVVVKLDEEPYLPY